MTTLRESSFPRLWQREPQSACLRHTEPKDISGIVQ